MTTAATETRCYTGALIAGLPAPVQVVLNGVLADKSVPTGRILAVLEKHGISPERAENVNRHRRRLQGGNYACKCPLSDKATE